jgi:acetyltransferase-like isoleucine patch superfamily enzyme
VHPIKFFWGLRAVLYKLFFLKVGKLTYIGHPCFIEGSKRISIGNKTRIFPGIRMEAIGSGKIVIGNNCAIEQNVHITSMNSDLIIGDNVTILANSFITNIDHEYRNIDKGVLEQGCILRETVIGDGCFLGYGAAIQAGTILGKHCVVGTNAVVRGYFPDFCVLVGCPAKIIKKYNIKTREWESYVE